MTFARWAGARVCAALAGVFVFAGLAWSAEVPLGITSLVEWRPGYHKIGSVAPGSPAEAIGLKSGLVIVAIDGKVVGEPGKIRKYIKDKGQITIIYHDGERLYEVTADLEGYGSSKWGGKVIGKPRRRAIEPPGGGT
jgi:S1-C subfamily serine protease